MAWEQRELLEYHRCSPTQKGVLGHAKESKHYESGGVVRSLLFRELSKSTRLFLMESNRGEDSWGPEPVLQLIRSSVLELYSEFRKRQELLMSYWSFWESKSSEAPLWSWVCNHILCWTGAEVRCRNPDPDIQEDTFWGNQNSQLKAEDSNRGQGKLPELGWGDNMKESTLYHSDWEMLWDWAKDNKLQNWEQTKTLIRKKRLHACDFLLQQES